MTALPLQLTVYASPADGPVGVRTTIVASLRNPTDAPQVVNRRMLLNHRWSAGEVWMDVEGPDGYRNTRGYQIRAGEAASEYFDVLPPGGAIDQTWTLNDFQSLHLPGEYRVTLTYHNESSSAPDGRQMAVGTVTGATQLCRHD